MDSMHDVERSGTSGMPTRGMPKLLCQNWDDED